MNTASTTEVEREPGQISVRQQVGGVHAILSAFDDEGEMAISFALHIRYGMAHAYLSRSTASALRDALSEVLGEGETK